MMVDVSRVAGLNITVLLLVAVCVDANPQSAKAHGDTAPAERQRLAGLVPNTPAPQARAEFYDSAHLFEYMDGAADVFQLYDVETLLHQEFRAGTVELTLDLFDMGNSDSAFGIYSAERSPTYDFVSIGGEGYRNEGILNFFQDRYYVKLAAFGDGADRSLDQFARALSARIGGGKSFPSLLAQLPAAHRKPHSEQYLRKDPLGHPFLSPAYQAVYSWGEGESTLLISVGKDHADAQARMKSLTEHFRRTGKCVPAPEISASAIRAGNSFEGTLVAAVEGRYLVLLLNPSADAGDFFRSASAQLK